MEMYRSVSIDCAPITLKDKIEYFQKNDHLGCWQLFRGSCTSVVRFLLPKIDRKMAGTGQAGLLPLPMKGPVRQNFVQHHFREHPHWTINTTQKFS
jgi:hypothetical protein